MNGACPATACSITGIGGAGRSTTTVPAGRPWSSASANCSWCTDSVTTTLPASASASANAWSSAGRADGVSKVRSNTTTLAPACVSARTSSACRVRGQSRGFIDFEQSH